MTEIHNALREVAPEVDEPETFLIHDVPGFVPSEAMPILEPVETAEPKEPISEFKDDFRFVLSTPMPANKFVDPDTLPRAPIKPRSAMEPLAGRPSRQIAGRTKPPIC